MIYLYINKHFNYSTQHTVHSTQHTAHSTQHTAHSTLFLNPVRYYLIYVLQNFY